MKSRDPYGMAKLTFVDRLGIYLSLRAIKKFLPKNNNLKILDLGCGYNAKLLLALQNQYQAGTGVDFSINPVLKEKTNIHFIESPIEHAFSHLNNQKFDIILLTSVLEHLHDPVETLKNCYQALTPDGALFINVPTWRGKFFLEFSAFKLGTSPKIEMDDHKMYYDKRDLWPILVKSGFKPSKMKLKYHKFGLNLFSVATK